MFTEKGENSDLYRLFRYFTKNWQLQLLTLRALSFLSIGVTWVVFKNGKNVLSERPINDKAQRIW